MACKHEWVFISSKCRHRHGLAWQTMDGLYTYWCPKCGSLQQVYRKPENRGLHGEDTVDTFQPAEKSS